VMGLLGVRSEVHFSGRIGAYDPALFPIDGIIRIFPRIGRVRACRRIADTVVSQEFLAENAVAEFPGIPL